MKRFVFCGLAMLLTFAFGFGMDRLIQYGPRGNEVAPAEPLPSAELNIIPVRESA